MKGADKNAKPKRFLSRIYYKNYQMNELCLLWFSHALKPSYLCSFNMDSMSKDFNLFGCRFVLMNIDMSYKQFLMSSIVYPVRLWTFWLFQISVFSYTSPSLFVLLLVKKFLFWYFSRSRSYIFMARIIEHAAITDGLYFKNWASLH